MIKSYYQLIKPGVMYGNLLTTIAGFLFASNGNIDWFLLLATTLGTGLVISSACVINNYLDQDIDVKMDRTKKRPLITGEVSPLGAIIFGIMLGIIGLLILILFTNWWVVSVGVLGFITYVWLYGALSKRLSVHGTLVGSISGALPIFAGYVAVTPGIDIAGVILLGILFFWQIPEFYSISIFRLKEYATAGIPVSSVVRGVATTKIQIFIYTYLTVFFVIALSATYLGTLTYLVVMLVISSRWIYIALEGLNTDRDEIWSREMFRYSILMLLIFSIMISVNPYLI